MPHHTTTQIKLLKPPWQNATDVQPFLGDPRDIRQTPLLPEPLLTSEPNSNAC
jgi:hypothetical protein